MRGMKLIMVSNRLPFSPERKDDGWVLHPSSGGLATALRSFCRQNEGVWVGWPGTQVDKPLKRLLTQPIEGSGFRLAPVSLTEEERRKFYGGFANEIVWPLFHDLQSWCKFDPEYWKTYRQVGAKFAEPVLAEADGDSLVWVHDYHLMLVAKHLRQRGLPARLGYFHHIPFPSPEIFEKLPWRSEVLDGLLQHDLIGFQTKRDVRNFIRSVQEFVPEVFVEEVEGRWCAFVNGRQVWTGAFPISIDFLEFAEEATHPEVTQKVQTLREELRTRYLLLGVDRLDYTKGMVERLHAFRALLMRAPELAEQVTLVQVAVPSRESVPKYRDIRLSVERMVSKINGRFTRPGWVPIHYLYRHLTRRELLAYYRAADVAVVTPLKDGMNLVAKEYCASQVDENGVLVLSEFAGAAAQLGEDALLVNPYHTESVAAVLEQACRLRLGERRARMKRLRKIVCEQDVWWWAESFLAVLEQPSSKAMPATLAS